MADRRAAHAVLFAHRHPLPSAAFHGEIIDAWHGKHPRVATEAFRDAAKSTTGEEVACLRAWFREFRNGLIIGASEQRAMERLEAIRHELDTNEDGRMLFGPMRGVLWGGHKALLATGALIQALGVGQSLRGVKHHQWRPDFCWIDDIEDEESVRTPEARRERLLWLYNVLIPALEKDALVRMTGNRLDTESVIATVAKDPDWLAQRFPVMSRDASGAFVATWPEKYDLDWIASRKAQFERIGDLAGWEREYMCEAELPVDQKAFKPEVWRFRPRVRTWQPVYAMYDPARVTGAQAATTGKAVWSWVGSKLVVWAGSARRWMPSETIDDLFATDRQFQPVKIGIERDGLEEWLLQPIRERMARLGHVLPLASVKAPQGKIDFIKGLEVYSRAGDIEFAFEDDALKAQFLSFPRPPIDFPNALAYALRLRPGLPIFPEFTEHMVRDRVEPLPGRPYYLALNATGSYVAAVLLQLGDRVLVHADWLREGDAATVLPALLREATLAAGQRPKCYCAPQHFNSWTNVGLVQAAVRQGADVAASADPVKGREELRQYMRRSFMGEPCLSVCAASRWTLNALAGGYAHALAARGTVEPAAEDGIYRILMEGIESWAALLAAEPRGDGEGRYATARDGRRYLSAMPGR